MTFDPHQIAPQPLLHSSLEANSSASGWFSQVTRRLSVSQKIGCGYGLALGIAILGTTVGVGIGNYYQVQARHQMTIADDLSSFLNRLQGTLLAVQAREHGMIPMLRNPSEFRKKNQELLANVAEAEKAFRELKDVAQTTSVAGLNPLIQKYDGTVEAYFQQLNALIQQVDTKTLKPEQQAKQQLILNFIDSSIAVELDKLSQELVVFGKIVREKQEEADVATGKAAALQIKILAASMLLSVALAGLLAIYTSRAIAHPIQATTRIAQRVTQEANFDIAAPVTTLDEIGVLTVSFNQLIQRVKQLLEDQQAVTQNQLIQSEKMSSLGRMMAGVAHEINNPVNFIYGNVVHASDYIQELLELLETYTELVPHPPQAVVQKVEEIDLEFLKEDLPKVLESMQLGANRVRQIVLSLKDFSRLDEAEGHSVDLHACIDSTLLILSNSLKKDITVVRNYGDISQIEGYAGLLYQVFMNLLSNAIDALEEKEILTSPKEIVISTQSLDKDWVEVRIADNGPGITAENQAKIFDAFFTTKPRGIGTGLGLAISYQIVVDKHRGKISCKSELDKGTEFAIALPIKRAGNTSLIPPMSQPPQSEKSLLS